MAKITTEHNFYIVDLVRNRPKSDYISIPPCRVNVTIKIEAKNKVPSSKLKRLEEAARNSLEKIEDQIVIVASESTKKIEALIAEGNADASAKANREIQGANVAIRGALNYAEKEAQKAVEQQRKKEGKQDALLQQAKVMVVVKVGKAALATTTAFARSFATGGVDVTGFISAASACYSAYKAIDGLCADESKKCQALIHGVDKYLTAREKKLGTLAERYVQDFTGYDKKDPVKALKDLATRAEKLAEQQAATEEAAGQPTTKAHKAADFAKSMLGFLKKETNAYASGVETARKNYRNGIASYRKSVDKASSASDKLKAEAKKIPALVPVGAKGNKLNAQAIKAAAEAMQFQRRVTKMSKMLDNRIKFLDAMQSVMGTAKITFADKTLLDKVKGMDKWTMATEAGGMASTAKSILDLAKEVKKIAA
ncbi:MAG: hypothetical protein AAF557_22425 [Pseudomonadota bacterium]